MAIEVEQLIATLEARIDKYEKNLAKAYSTTGRQFSAIEARGKQMESRFAALMDKTGKNAASAFQKNFVVPVGAAFAATLSIDAIKNLIDSAVKIENQLKQTGLAGKDLTNVYDQLFASAQRNGTPLESLVTLYSRASAAAKDLHASQAELIDFSDGVAVALRASGQSAEESAGALLQLSQALGGGKIQAEEYNSLLDGGRTILQATANGLKEAGGSIGNLTKLVKAGKVSSEAFFRAFLAGKSTLEDSMRDSQQTVSQSLQTIENALIDAAGKFNEGTQASKLFGRAAASIASEINSFNFDNFIKQIEYVISALNRAASAAGGFLDYLGRISGAQDFAKNLVSKLPGDTVHDLFAGTPLAGSLVVTSQDAVQDRINGAFNLPQTVRSGLTPEQIQAFAAPKTNAVVAKSGRLPAATSTVSLNDFPVTPSSSTSGSKTKTDEFAKALQSTTAETNALKEQQAAMAGLKGASADYDQKVEAISKATDLLTTAQKSGAAVGKELSDVNQLLYGDLSKLTPEARKQAEAIRAAALGYADADARLKKLKETQEAAKQSLQDMIELEKDVAGGVLSDIRSALEDGKITWKEWGDIAVNALNKIADKLQDSLLDQLFKANPFGFLGTLGGAVTGGSVGGGVAAAGLRSSSLSQAPRLPNAAALKAARNDNVHVTVGFENDDLNLKPHVVKVARTEAASTGKAGLDQYRRDQFRQDVEKHLRSRRVRGTI